MNSVRIYSVAAVCLLAVCSVLGKNCVLVDQCRCAFDDGSGLVDLSSIGKQDGSPLFQDYPAQVDIYTYSYNPCYGFSLGNCANTVACQYDVNLFVYVDIGAATTTSFEYDGTNVIATYKSQDDSRKTEVTLVCDPGMVAPSIQVIGEPTTYNYYMTLTAAALCPRNGGDVSITVTGLSAGSVLLIIFFTVLPVYCIAGVVFNKVKREATGAELVPNLGFWTAIPTLVKEGCAFTVSIFMNVVCAGKRSAYTTPS